MTKVYVAHDSFEYEGIVRIIGVYELKKLAEGAIENYKEKNPIYIGLKATFEIEEFELNEFEKGKIND